MRYLIVCSIFFVQVYAQVLCHAQLPVSTVIDKAFFESLASPKECMPIHISDSSVVIYDTQKNITISLTKETIEIHDKNAETSQKQTRQSLGHYSKWVDATEKVLRGKALWHGECVVHRSVRKCRHMCDTSQELTIFQRDNMPRVWVIQLRTTDGDTLTQWWLQDAK